MSADAWNIEDNVVGKEHWWLFALVASDKIRYQLNEHKYFEQSMHKFG